jgi:hypothetical protein
MTPTNGSTNWDSLLISIPLVGLLIFVYFRVDEIFRRKKPTANPRHREIPVRDPADVSMMTDPDGRPWQ